MAPMAGTTRPAQSRRKNRGPEGAIVNSSTSHICASAFKKEGGRRPGAGVGLWVLGLGAWTDLDFEVGCFLVVVVPHVGDGVRAFVSSHARTHAHAHTHVRARTRRYHQLQASFKNVLHPHKHEAAHPAPVTVVEKADKPSYEAPLHNRVVQSS